MQDSYLRVQFYRHIGFLPQKTESQNGFFFHENCVPGKEDMEEAQDGKGFGQNFKLIILY